ncbi:MAG: hypothetical protein Q4A96_03770, partial [Candidatus Saccharibacteria bacterium]|nr:hypothetical protein [Candidatus Saccharibacteria bacterium]
MLEKTQSIARKGFVFLCVVAVICSAIFGVTTIAAVDKFHEFIETPSVQAADISDVNYVVNDAIEEPQAKNLVELKPVSSSGNNGSGSGGIINVTFGNDTVQNDGIDSNNYNFNHNLWLDGMNADEAFDVFFSWLSCDPCLMAATATGIQSRIGDIGLQAKESGITGLEEKANASAFSYYDDRAYWQNDLNTLYNYLSEKPRKIDEIGDYNSAMYQSHYDGSILPRIVVRKTKNSNGHAIAFELAPGTEVRFRLECGFQMVDIIETYVPETT